MKDSNKKIALEQRIAKLKESADNKKWKRVKRTFFVLCGVVFLAVFVLGEIRTKQDFFIYLLCTPVASGLIMAASTLVMLYVTSGAMEDEKHIARLEGELNTISSLNDE